MIFDVLIIGASAAGVSSAIYLARRNLNFKLIGSDFGGEMALSGEVGNFPGWGFTNGLVLTDKFLEHLKLYKIEPELGLKVKNLDKKSDFFVAKTETGEEFQAKSVIIATGSHPRLLGVSGEAEFRNKGLSYCTVCDGPIFKDKVVVTVGGGDSASESGIMMSGIASQVYVLTKNFQMKGDSSLIKKLESLPNVKVIFNAQTTKIFGSETISGIEYQDLSSGETRTIKADGVFVHIGMIPNSDFVMPELAKNQSGEIIIDREARTNLAGVFACGDVTDMPYKQIGIASGQGIVAALSVVDYLNKLS